jgi:TolB-like protein/Tfp pilus assembly protein PilF
MGLHTGDIIIKDGHVFGDGVNVASRIESLSVPGSILISDKVKEELNNHPGIKTVLMGNFNMKNIERGIDVYAIAHESLFIPEAGKLKGKTTGKKIPVITPQLKKSIAVLPFINMSNDPEQEYFSDGITEEILNSLSRLNNLKVVGRTSSFQFKGKNISLINMGEKLGVKNILEGSVRKQQNRLRITVQLTNVENGFNLWSEKYDREMDDIFAIQDEIASSVTEKLKITLLESEKNVTTGIPTENKEAYDLYLRGRFYWNRRGPGLKKALEYFLKAAALDNDFSLAYAGIADTYALFAFYSVLPAHQVIPRAKEAAEKAIALNPDRVEPYSVLAFITAFYDWNWAEAKKQFEKTININSGYAPVHYWFSNFLSWAERDFLHSEQEAYAAIELEPLISHSHSTLASVYICSGEYEKARMASLAGIEIDAGSFLAYTSLGMALYKLGKTEEAIEAIRSSVEVSGRHQYTLLILSWLYSMKGDVAGARDILEEMEQRSKTEFISGLALATAAYSSKDYTKAHAYLEKAFEEKASLLVSISGYPFFSFIKTDPLFQPYLERMKYPFLME